MSRFVDYGGSRERFTGLGQYTLYLDSKCLKQENEEETARVLGEFIAALTKQLETADIKPSKYINETDLTINPFISITKARDKNGNYISATTNPDTRRILREEFEQSNFFQVLKNRYEEFYPIISPQDLKNFIKLDNLYSSYLNFTRLFFLLGSISISSGSVLFAASNSQTFLGEFENLNNFSSQYAKSLGATFLGIGAILLAYSIFRFCKKESVREQYSESIESSTQSNYN